MKNKYDIVVSLKQAFQAEAETPEEAIQLLRQSLNLPEIAPITFTIFDESGNEVELGQAQVVVSEEGAPQE